jgi:hypothetical protein
MSVDDSVDVFFGDADDFFGPTTEKRRGRPRGSLNKATRALREAIADLTDRYDRMTVRQAFYALEVAGHVPKTESGYR